MFEQELQELINRHSIENSSDTPDFILAKYIQCCLYMWEKTVRERDKWYGFEPWPKNTIEKAAQSGSGEGEG